MICCSWKVVFYIWSWTADVLMDCFTMNMTIDFLWANQEPYAPNTYFLSNPHCVVVCADYRWPNGLLIIFSDQTWKEDDIQFFFKSLYNFFSKANKKKLTVWISNMVLVFCCPEQMFWSNYDVKQSCQSRIAEKCFLFKFCYAIVLVRRYLTSLCTK